MSQRPLVLICEKFSLEAEMKLRESGLFHVEKLTTLDSSNPTESILKKREELLNQAHILVIRSRTQINAHLLEKTPQLKLIVTCTSGFDHIDLDATSQRSITVMYTPQANAQAAAELTWGLLLSSLRKLTEAHREVKSGTWNRESLLSFECAGKTLGIIGLGRIGQKVARFAEAFSMKVIAFDPYQDDDVFLRHHVQRVSYEEILKLSDIMTFHVPLTQETKHMLRRTHFEYTSRHLIVINASRGAVIHEDDLCEALEKQQIAFAALDVFNKEPLSRESKLLKSNKVLLSPHIGAMTEEAFKKASLEASIKIIEFWKLKKSSDTLPLINDWGSLMFEDQKN